MDINALKYSPVNRTHAIEMMHTLRDRILLPDDTLKGSRFNDDNHTMWVLESQTKEEEFIQDPVYYVCQALIESAKSDHWYAHDKRWDDDDYGYEEDMEVEE